MIDDIQHVMKHLGDEGCYFLSLLHVAERVSGKDIDPARAYVACRDEGLIRVDCFVNDPPEVLARYAGGGWTVRKEPANYQCLKDEIEILYFERVSPGVIYPHFVVGDGNGKVLWDPWKGSLTVSAGQLKSKRICWRAS